MNKTLKVLEDLSDPMLLRRYIYNTKLLESGHFHLMLADYVGNCANTIREPDKYENYLPEDITETAIVCIRWASEMFHNSRKEVLDDIVAERQRQDEKWGADRELGSTTWHVILSEEFGECANAFLEDDMESLYAEIIQTAAVAVAWLETMIEEEEAGETPEAEEQELASQD